MEVQQVELWRIREPERPLREGVDSEYIGTLAESIKARGLLNPIRVRARDGFYEVVAGHCRLLAVRRLGWPLVSVVVGDVDDEGATLDGAAENLIRRDMSVREEARLVAALMGERGWGIAATARALNRGEGWIRDRIDLLGWPAGVVDGVSSGRLSMGVAKALMGIENEQARERLLHHAITSGVSVEVARRWRDLENLGEGAASQQGNLVGVNAPSALSGGSLPCFFCDERSSYGEMTYVWGHRECIVAMDDALRPKDGGAVPEAPPGGGAGGASEDVPGAQAEGQRTSVAQPPLR